MDYRAITAEEIDPFFASLATAFADAHPDPDELRSDRMVLEPDRTFAAFDEGRIVGCAGVFTQQMVVPGGALVPTAGVTLVGVLPTHRRRGILRELMMRMFDQALERGEVVTTLFASEAAIYGRFGFGAAAHHLSFDLALDRVRWAPDTGPTGRVVLHSREEAMPAMRDIYSRAFLARPGALEADATWMEVAFWESSKDDERLFYAVHEDDAGTPDAFAMYRTKHEWPRGLPSVEMTVRRHVAVSPEASASLWRFLFDVDLVSRVKAETRAVDDPLLLQLAEPRSLRPELDDGLLLRPLSVVGALEARGYAADGRVVLAVTDASMPANDGIYELVVTDRAATCRLVQSEPDIVCSVHALGSTYLGGFTWSALARAGRIEVRTPEVLDTIDAMFRSDVAPWPMYYF
ncbi:MAG: GNAT family N-acetyltransferase [Actinomycetota bacterium]